MVAAIATVLPPGDAQRSRMRSPGLRVDDQRHELRRFVLDEERVVFGPCAAGCPVTDESRPVRSVSASVSTS